jgi:hypothetical protein
MGESPQGQAAGGGVQEVDDGGGGGTQVRKAPCKVCGEPRGNANPCPHCGMD